MKGSSSWVGDRFPRLEIPKSLEHCTHNGNQFPRISGPCTALCTTGRLQKSCDLGDWILYSVLVIPGSFVSIQNRFRMWGWQRNSDIRWSTERIMAIRTLGILTSYAAFCNVWGFRIRTMSAIGIHFLSNHAGGGETGSVFLGGGATSHWVGGSHYNTLG